VKALDHLERFVGFSSPAARSNWRGKQEGSGVARYRVIAADLAAKIRDGQYAPGEALPAQRELSAAYGVTLMTLRQALRELGAEGLIVQQPGKGTFVAPPHLAYQLGSLRSLADDLREQGHEVRTTVIARAQCRVPPRIAARLRVRETETGLRLERVRAFAGRRAIHQISWVPEPPADRLRDVDFATTSLYAALADAGVAVARASETIRPEVLDADVARHLDEDEGAPVLVSDRVTYGPDGTALVADRATILGRMMQITADRAVTGLSLHWGATPSL
jgi:GntR family transcriptional regulator